jgi:hypothetical protein
MNIFGRYYRLDGHTPVPTDDPLVAFGRDANHRVALTERGGIKVSTVFLATDHAWDGGPPLLFETMIFGGDHDEDQWRYSTWDEAVAGHEEACRIAFTGTKA